MLKQMLYVIVGTMLFASDSSIVHAQHSAQNYHLVFSDEFNQRNGSMPDTTKWSIHERQQCTWARWISGSPKVISVRNGSLVCRAIPNQSEPNDTARMLTGAICSMGKFEFQYGKVEVRMKTNRKQGNFPAAWMVRPDCNTTYGEIDIVETFGLKKMASHAIHSKFTYHNDAHGLNNIFQEEIDITKWHVYSVEWTSDYVRWEVDGKTVGFFMKPTSSKKISEGQWTFDHPFYLILNQSVGNGEYGNYANYNQSYETKFDWIRVYQKNE